jgi:hypothetical protein
MLQLSGDAGFLDESAVDVGLAGLVGPHLFEGDVASQVVVMSQPHLANAAFGVDARQGVAVAAFRLVRQRREQHMARAGGRVGQGLLDVRVGDIGQEAAGGRMQDSGQRGVSVASVLLQLAFQQAFDVAAILRRQPTALDHQLRQRFVLAGRPGRTRLGKLGGVQQVGLQCQHAE